MFKNFKLAGTLFGALFSTNPNISDEDKQALATALDTDVDGLKAEHAAAQTAEIDLLKAELGIAQGSLTAKEQELTDLQAKVTDLEPKATKLAEIEPEYNTMKSQLDAYKAKVSGAKPNETTKAAAKTIEDEREEHKANLDEIERLKAEHPYSFG
jgi:chromosome segregation ATPase